MGPNGTSLEKAHKQMTPKVMHQIRKELIALMEREGIRDSKCQSRDYGHITFDAEGIMWIWHGPPRALITVEFMEWYWGTNLFAAGAA